MKILGWILTGYGAVLVIANIDRGISDSNTLLGLGIGAVGIFILAR